MITTMASTLIVYASASTISLLNSTDISFVEAQDKTDIIQHCIKNPAAIVVFEINSINEDIALLRELKAHADAQSLSYLVISQAEHFSAAIDAGATELIQQPPNIIEFQTRLKTLQAQGIRMSGILDVLTHDLNSPLGITEYSLKLLLEILDDMADAEPEIYQITENVLRANYRLRFMVFDLLDYFRIKEGAFEIAEKESFTVFPVLRYVLDRLEPIAQENNIELRLASDKDMAPVMLHRNLFERIIIAALDTAIKFCQSGNTITVKTAIEATSLVINIEDNGQPIQENYDGNTIFDFKLATQMREAGNRTTVGVSMPFIELATELMGGSVNVVSNKELTRLTITLPTQ